MVKFYNKIIEIGLPLIITAILFSFQQLGEKYILHILLISLGLIISATLIYLFFRFLDEREKRWIGNKQKHELYENEIQNMKEDIKNIRIEIKMLNRELRINEKINKLEKQLLVKRGKK